MQIIVTPEDVEAIWRPLTDAEKATVNGLARYAWLILAPKKCRGSLIASPPTRSLRNW